MKKTIKSTISIILALCMLLASLAACEKEEPNNKPVEEKHKATIIWICNARIEDGKAKFKIDRGQLVSDEYTHDEVPEDILDFIYNYEEMDDHYVKLFVELHAKYKPTLEDMSEEYQEKYREYKKKYGTLTGRFLATDDPERSAAYSLICSMARKELNEKFDTFYNNLNFSSSVSPRLSLSGCYIEEGSDLSYGYCITYYFTDFFDTSLENFTNWEWSDINKLAELEWIEKIRVVFSADSYDCT